MKGRVLAFAVVFVACATAMLTLWARILVTPTLNLPYDNRWALKTEPDIEIEEYAVFSAVLEHSYIDSKSKLLVFQSQTSKDESEEYRNYEIEEILRPLADQDTINDFWFKNSSPEQVRDLFTVAVEHSFVTPEQVTGYFGEGGGWWDAFYRDYRDSSG